MPLLATAYDPARYRNVREFNAAYAGRSKTSFGAADVERAIGVRRRLARLASAFAVCRASGTYVDYAQGIARIAGENAK